MLSDSNWGGLFGGVVKAEDGDIPESGDDVIHDVVVSWELIFESDCRSSVPFVLDDRSG